MTYTWMFVIIEMDTLQELPVSKDFIYPNTLSKIDDLLITMPTVLVFKKMVEDNIDVLSRPYSASEDSTVHG
jgi:hypothetical protein